MYQVSTDDHDLYLAAINNSISLLEIENISYYIL